MRISKVFEYNSANNSEASTELDFSIHPFVDTSLIYDTDEIDGKLISKLERIVRNSIEYREYIKYLKNEMNMKSCMFLQNINLEDSKVSIEFHHSPYTLFDIVSAVLNKAREEANGKPISRFTIAEEVVGLHYKNIIGLIPLTVTIHELVHSKSLIIPYKSIYGNVKEFNDEYGKWISPEALERFANAELLSAYDSPIEIKRNAEKLKINVLHYNVSYDK